MSKVTIIFEDGTSKEINKVSKIKMSNNGIGYCLSISEWHDAFVDRFKTRNKLKNIELQEVIENLPHEYWNIGYTPADATYESYWNSHFTIEANDRCEIVNSVELLDALRKLIEIS